MRLLSAAAALVIVALTATAPAGLTQGTVFAQGTMSAAEQANLTLVQDWWRLVIQARVVADAEKFMAPDYIQHNPNINTGRDAFVKIFGARPPVTPVPREMTPPPIIEFAKGPYVVFVWEREAKDAMGVAYKYNFFDIVRVENGRVAEHWDSVFRPVPAAGQPAPMPVIPGIGPRPVKPRNTPAEQANEDLANILYKDILQYGHVELAEKVMAPGYIQHNPNVPTGRAGFVEFFSKIRQPEPIRAEWKDEPELVITSGNMVLHMFKRFSADPSTPGAVYKWNWFDLVRVDGGLVREHWDMAMKTPPPESVPMPAGFREYR